MELQSQGEAEHCILLLHPSHNQEPSATSPHTLSTRWCEPGLWPGLHPSPRLPAWELPLPAAEEGWSRYLLLWLLQCVTVAWLSGRERRTAPSAPCPLAITHRQAHGTGIQALVISVPLYQSTPSLSVPVHAGEHQPATSSCPGSQEGWHTQCAAAGCTCCLSSRNWCSHSSPCSRCPGVPCRFSWTYTHSGDMSVGNKRERCALMSVKGKSGCFPYFPPGCSSQPWQEWGSACCARGLIPASQAFVPPSQGGRGQSRTPPRPGAAPGLPQPSARRWRGSQELDGICCCLGVTHTNSNLAAT